MKTRLNLRVGVVIYSNIKGKRGLTIKYYHTGTMLGRLANAGMALQCRNLKNFELKETIEIM